MPSQKLPLSATNSPTLLSSWPLIKYSYSVSSTSSIALPPWTHFPHRDNVFLVIDTQRVPGYIQNDGKFTDKQTRLKIVWGLETLEILDLRSLTQQIMSTHGLQQFDTPTFIALGRSPSLAIKYYKTEDQTVRRFQIKFPSDTAYKSALELLEKANCPVGAPPKSRDDNRYESSSQVQLCPLVPLTHNVQVLRTPPGTSSGYLSGSTSSSSPTTLPRDSPSLGNSSTYINSVSQNYAPSLIHGMATSNKVATSVTPRELCQQDNHQPSYLSNATTLPIEEYIPPPRPPPSFGSRKHIESPSIISSKRDVVGFISSLPPLPIPTPLNKPPRMNLCNSDFSTCLEASFDSSPRSEPKINTFHQEDNKNLAKRERERCGIYRPGLPGIAEEYMKGVNLNDRGSLPAFAYDRKKLEPETSTPPLHISNNRQKSDLGVVAIGNTGDTNTGGKRKQEDEGQGQRKKQREECSRAHEEEELRQIEDFIVDAIHDDDFLKLVERIGCIWQRMGFNEVGQNFFGTGVLGG